jgi:phosphoglycerate dehydrogenase-like enzyme
MLRRCHINCENRGASLDRFLETDFDRLRGAGSKVDQPDTTFIQAYRTIRSRYSVDEWLFLLPQQITEEIYNEMRRLDLVGSAKTG